MRSLGFEHLEMVVPATSRSVFSLLDDSVDAAAERERLERHGLSRVPVATGSTTAMLMSEAISLVLAQVTAPHERVGLVMLVHSLSFPAASGADFVDACLDRHGLHRVPAVAVSGQPCAILHQAVALAGCLLRNSPAKGVLVVGADVANNDSERVFFGSAMGDAAIAGLLVANASRHQVLATFTDTDIYAWEGELSPPEAIDRFRTANPLAIRTAILTCVASAGMHLGDLAMIVPHTPNRLIWDAVAALLKMPRNFIRDDGITQTGHLNSNDAFIHYLRFHQAGDLKRGDIALLVNPGFGGTRGCTLMRC